MYNLKLLIFSLLVISILDTVFINKMVFCIVVLIVLIFFIVNKILKKRKKGEVER